MVRHVITASGALMFLVGLPLAPQAAAADDQTVLISDSKVRCLVSANDFPRGGGPMLVCQQVDGQPWGAAPYALEKNASRLNLAIFRSTGEFRWDKGDIGAPVGATETVVSPGQTYHINGWTIQPEDLRTRFTYDATGHAIYVNVSDARPI